MVAILSISSHREELLPVPNSRMPPHVIEKHKYLTGHQIKHKISRSHLQRKPEHKVGDMNEDEKPSTSHRNALYDKISELQQRSEPNEEAQSVVRLLDR
jgi:hypothetical protein